MSAPTQHSFLNGEDSMEISSQHGSNADDIVIETDLVDGQQDIEHDEYMAEVDHERDDEPMGEAGHDELEDRAMADEDEIDFDDDEDQVLRDVSREVSQDQDLPDVQNPEHLLDTSTQLQSHPAQHNFESSPNGAIATMPSATTTMNATSDNSDLPSADANPPIVSQNSISSHSAPEANLKEHADLSTTQPEHTGTDDVYGEDPGDATPKASANVTSAYEGPATAPIQSSHNLNHAHLDHNQEDEEEDEEDSTSDWPEVFLEFGNWRAYLFPPEGLELQRDEYVLDSSSVVSAELGTLFIALREALVDEIAPGQELELAFGGLDLVLSEVHSHAKYKIYDDTDLSKRHTAYKCATTLADVLDLYAQMAFNDKIESPEPLTVYLTLIDTFQDHFERLKRQVKRGRGFSHAQVHEHKETHEDHGDDESINAQQGHGQEAAGNGNDPSAQPKDKVIQPDSSLLHNAVDSVSQAGETKQADAIAGAAQDNGALTTSALVSDPNEGVNVGHSDTTTVSNAQVEDPDDTQDNSRNKDADADAVVEESELATGIAEHAAGEVSSTAADQAGTIAETSQRGDSLTDTNGAEDAPKASKAVADDSIKSAPADHSLPFEFEADDGEADELEAEDGATDTNTLADSATIQGPIGSEVEVIHNYSKTDSTAYDVNLGTEHHAETEEVNVVQEENGEEETNANEVENDEEEEDLFTFSDDEEEIDDQQSGTIKSGQKPTVSAVEEKKPEVADALYELDEEFEIDINIGAEDHVEKAVGDTTKAVVASGREKPSVDSGKTAITSSMGQGDAAGSQKQSKTTFKNYDEDLIDYSDDEIYTPPSSTALKAKISFPEAGDAAKARKRSISDIDASIDFDDEVESKKHKSH